jgi:glutathione S-transferase
MRRVCQLSEYVLEHIIAAGTFWNMTTHSAAQPARLYYFETLNPQKACAVAKYLDSPVEYVRVDLSKGEHKQPAHMKRNPNGKVPVLEHEHGFLWESAAIMAWLARRAESPLWPEEGDEQTELLRWISWDATFFVRRAGTFYFEHYIKPLLRMGAPDEQKIAAVTPEFHESAAVLDAHLSGRKFVLGERLTIADFCIGATLLHADQIHLPLASYTHVRRWHDRLMELPAWRNPWPVI